MNHQINENKKKGHREPLFHIVKRSREKNISLGQAVLTRAVAIISALIFCGILTFILTGTNPFEFYSRMVIGNFGSFQNLLVTLENTAILLCISIAVTPAFKMKFWNTGAEGQVLVGGLATAACMYYLQGLPIPLLLLIAFISSMIAGGIWGLIPAVFKAFWNTNETLFTLMMNYVAMQLILFFMKRWNTTSSSIDFTQLDPKLEIFDFFGGGSGLKKYLICITLVLIVTLIIHIYLKYSKHGYEISVVGESENTARYIGINIKTVIMRTMIISGLICGLAGFLLVAPAQNISSSIANGRGFTAIMVSWLAKFNPLMMILTSFLLVFLEIGALEVATSLGVDPSYPDIITGIILFFIIGCEFLVQYQILPTQRLKKMFNKNKEVD